MFVEEKHTGQYGDIMKYKITKDPAKISTRKKWTKEENEIIILNNEKSIHSLFKLLPLRSKFSIERQRSKLQNNMGA